MMPILEVRRHPELSEDDVARRYVLSAKSAAVTSSLERRAQGLVQTEVPAVKARFTSCARQLKRAFSACLRAIEFLGRYSGSDDIAPLAVTFSQSAYAAK
jgi:hypothetical protein